MLNKNSSRRKWTGSLKGSVPLLLLLISVCLFSTMVLAQTEKKKITVSDSVLGIGIGTSLSEAHAKLDSLGINGGRDTRGGGRKESWALEGTPFSALALKTNSKGKVVWVTGFVRPGQEIPFEKLGNLAASTRSGEFETIWNVETPEGGYRLVAKGQDGKANVIYLLSLETTPVE